MKQLASTKPLLTKDSFGIQGLIWNLFWYMSSREILRDMHLNLARSMFWDLFTKYFWTLHNFVKILETCLMII